MDHRATLAAPRDRWNRTGMTPERWQQVKEVLNGALHVGGEERAAFLGRACETDPSLRIEVDALLASAPDVTE
jgi:hypothetical protein